MDEKVLVQRSSDDLYVIVLSPGAGSKDVEFGLESACNCAGRGRLVVIADLRDLSFTRMEIVLEAIRSYLERSEPDLDCRAVFLMEGFVIELIAWDEQDLAYVTNDSQQAVEMARAWLDQAQV